MRQHWLDGFQMSLINQMLQDLDSRGTESVGTGAMYAQIRSVPAIPKHRSLRWLWLVAVVFVLIGFAAAWQWKHLSATVAGPTPTAAPAPRPEQLAPPMPIQSSLLDLKLSSDLSIGPLREESSAAAEATDKGDNLQPPQVDALPVDRAGNRQADSTEKSAKAENKVHALDHPAAGVAPKPVARAPAVGSTSMSIQPSGNNDSVHDKPIESAPVSLNKQVAELTVQQRAENEFRKALMLAQQGKQSEAISDLETALRLDPRKTAARQTLAGLLIAAKRQEEAAQKLQEGLTVDPAQAGLAMILARLQVDKGDVQHAIDTLQHSLPYAVDRADYQAFIAALFQRDARHKDAIEHYVAALRMSPQNGVWWMGLGISLQADNRVKDAQEAFVRAKASNMLSPELLSFVDQKLNQLKH
jgi:MSHA biogenesis protein MshN